MNNKSVIKIITSSVGKNLLFWILLIGIVPLLIFSSINYYITYNTLKNQVISSLKDSINIRTDKIENYFEEYLKDLELQSLLDENSKILDSFKTEYEKSQLTLNEFVKGYKWKLLDEKHGGSLRQFSNLNKYHDIFLIDKNGDILFTVEQEEDLGTNIINGKYSKTLFSKGCKEVLEKGVGLFTDLEFYGPSRNKVSGFLIDVLLDNNGDISGLVAFQIDGHEITNVVNQESKAYKTFNVYIIGKDLKLRTKPLIGNFNKVLIDKRNNIIATNFKKYIEESENEHEHDKDLVEKELEKESHEEIETYKNEDDSYVIASHRHIDISGAHYVIVSEISKKEAYLGLEKQRDLIFTSLVLIILVVLVVAVSQTKKIVYPIVEMSDWAYQISLGDLSKREITTNDDEMGLLVESLVAVVDTFSIIKENMLCISNGDFNIELLERSEKDELSKAIKNMIKTLKNTAYLSNKIAQGDYNTEIEPHSDRDELGIALKKMNKELRENYLINEKNNWFKNGQAELFNEMRGDKDVRDLSKSIIVYLSKYLGAQIGTLYVANENKTLYLAGSYMFSSRKKLSNIIELGEGLVGEVALEKSRIQIEDIPDNYIIIESSLGNTKPKYILGYPIVLIDKIIGVIELASLKSFDSDVVKFLDSVNENIAISIKAAIERKKMKLLLEQTKFQAKELEEQQIQLKNSNMELQDQTEKLRASEEILQSQQDELRLQNIELQDQSEKLRASEEILQSQQDELKAQNEELEEKTRYLEKQKEEIIINNRNLQNSRNVLSVKAKELEESTRYKSEFLANMSHELRTPLNSLLLLSKNLMKNKKSNLFEKQLNDLKIIYSSGNELLNLINEILDLSKIESGKMTLNPKNNTLFEIRDYLDELFRHVIEEKNLKLIIDVNKNETIYVDEQKLYQILKNLISNAIKFTKEGFIKVSIMDAVASDLLNNSKLKYQELVKVSVKDTGIGIPQEKQNAIFEAFQQADGSTSREYGGTGLGLSITKELVRLLGGEIQLKSEIGNGSEFTFFIRKNYIDNHKAKVDTNNSNVSVEIKQNLPIIEDSIEDDKKNVTKDEKVILIIEDDRNFAKVIFDICKEKGFNCIHSITGEYGLSLMKKYNIGAVLLDINLPDIQGWEVLKRMRNDEQTRHIPVHVMSGDTSNKDLVKKKCLSFIEKPLTEEQLETVFINLYRNFSDEIKKLLIVEGNINLGLVVKDMFAGKNIEITNVASGEEALKKIEKKVYDSIILDLNLPDINGIDLLKKINKYTKEITPIIIYTGKELSEKEINELEKYSSSIVVKDKDSGDRLLDETLLFLHYMTGNNNQKLSCEITEKKSIDNNYEGKKIMIVDDDIRNIYSISTILEEFNFEIIEAGNGEMALNALNKHHDIDLILMDIMMPIMDGFEATKRIRKIPKYKDLPIIAITAKAMKEDKEKCLESGATDYLSKPIEEEKLISLVRVWLK